ncbi:hypothetical protein [Nocardioides sp. YIM 152315]|uniref:hypothetical protein n=1 Tax=Nocardioides sp. YIM 152315 TaxID=3031760 RepID=UPI0023DB5585|nr:hypothetical protein [Nocardioides sp. YIM 152315]MDF1601973.1 hypothetical protein [Nocardioides sp. YIM 152315]
MHVGLCWCGVVAAVWVVTALAASLVTATRGARYLERATALDVAAERRIAASTMWSWMDRFGADRLVLAVDADIAEEIVDLDGWETPAGSGFPVATDADLDQFDHLPPLSGLGLPLASWIPPPPDADEAPWPRVA